LGSFSLPFIIHHSSFIIQKYGNQSLDRKTEASRSDCVEVRGRSAEAEEGKELRGHRPIAAGFEPDAVEEPLPDHWPVARVPAEVQGLANHASRTGFGWEDSGFEKGKLVGRGL
jgi:hypothetical protein